MSEATMRLFVKVKTYNYRKMAFMTMTLLWLSACVIAWYLVITHFKDFQLEVRQKEGLKLLKSAYTLMKAEESRLGEWPTNIESPDLIGSAKLHYKLHLTETTLTEDELQTIPKNFRPYVVKDNFRILVIRKNIAHQKHSLCSLDNQSHTACTLIDSTAIN